jgi:hypothetical protein
MAVAGALNLFFLAKAFDDDDAAGPHRMPEAFNGSQPR